MVPSKIRGVSRVLLAAIISVLISSCASTEIVESPKTAFVPEVGEPREPRIVWTSRTFTQDYDYLAVVKVRSWTYQGAMDRLLEAGKKVRADAIVDVHYEEVGFLAALSGFAVKYKQ